MASESSRKLPPRALLGSIFVTAFGISFPFGFNLGVINLTQPLFEAYVNGSWYQQNGLFMDEGALHSLWSVIVACFTLGGALGGLAAPFAAERLGRKGGLIAAAVIMVIAAVLLGIAQPVGIFEVFAFGRTLAGLSSGLGACVLSVYLSEISAKELRGFSGAFLEVFLVFGKLTSLVVSLPGIMGNAHSWGWLVALPALQSLLLIVALPFFPETPSFIRAKAKGKDRSTKAVHKSVKFYRGSDVDAAAAVADIDEELGMLDSSLSLRAILKHPVFRQTLLLALVVRLGQELTGITAIFNFSAGVFKSLDFAEDFAEYNSIGIAAMSAVVTTCACFAVEHVGRRPLLVYGLLGTLICDCLFLICSEIYDYTGMRWAGFCCVVVLYLHVFIFSIGPGPVGWLVVPEFTPQVARAGVTSAGVFANWFSNLLVTAAFLPLKVVIGHYSFLMFIVPLAGCTAYLWYYLPETKDRPVSRITEEIMKGRRGQRSEPPIELKEEH